MSQFSAAVTPGRSLGFLALGSSLHDIVTRLKAEPQTFGKLELIYSPDHPVTEPVIVSLPTNGLRLRFDGPEQRLRLIEITDFSKSKLTYKNIDIVKPASPASPSSTSSSIPDSSSAGPTFKHIYNKLLAPSYPGDYVPPDANGDGKYGVYILSYPGIAFTFPVLASTWNPSKDYATMLALPSTKPATSMAVFIGDSWVEAQKVLYDELLEDPRSYSPSHKGKDVYPDEISLVNIFGEGKLRLDRAWGSTPFWLFLGQTTPQELVAELGPPDAIYRKSDQRMAIHKARAGSESQQTRPHLEPPGQDDSTDTDASSIRTGTSVSGDESDSGSVDGKMSKECFYNYFYHGFDILVSPPTSPSRPPPSTPTAISDDHPSPPDQTLLSPAPLVATKLILHSNIPGSYAFNRHRRCRWSLSYLSSPSPPTSESPYSEIATRLHEEWKSIYATEEEAVQRQRGMVLNRDWGDSPGSSVDLLGDWEEGTTGAGGRGEGVASAGGNGGLGNTTLYGFPGLVFEVLRGGVVCGLTVF
ncbi:hypothetical protein VE01_07580 [Pseudogymnoascus verrucosus]|uniref:Uncharacterized protein n=1 Tax=Pseudogymnoascus verrucosus TaxID=342668 RepID=A0A1B8GH79_9PEZI|nr:uncharacterized protein VE01_07580 [Pseudogymnoascus verrucosus]OBT95188.1 hypothetical protein VE01_07580 [Pseudogymnoascus verrucosus]